MLSIIPNWAMSLREDFDQIDGVLDSSRDALLSTEREKLVGGIV